MIITGGSGLLGTAFKEIIQDGSAKFPTRDSLNLLDNKAVSKYLSQENEVVIHLAGKVGGIKANINYK